MLNSRKDINSSIKKAHYLNGTLFFFFVCKEYLSNIIRITCFNIHFLVNVKQSFKIVT